MNERAAFEANIDRDPTDATNHLVYADWLQENGEPEEAEFRRAMGDWVRKPGVSNELEWALNKPRHHGGREFRVAMAYPFLPSWVFTGTPPVPGQGEARIAENLPTVDTPGGTDNFPHVAYQGPDPHDYYRYRTYRGAEEAFRRAFHQHRPARFAPLTNPKKLSRRSRFSRTLNKYR